MLTLLVIKLLFGGGSIELLEFISNIEDSVKIVVPQGERQKEALNTLKVMGNRVKARNKQEAKTAKNLARAFRDHGVNIAEADVIWVNYFEENDSYNSKMLDLRFELKEHINREEWAEIFPAY